MPKNSKPSPGSKKSKGPASALSSLRELKQSGKDKHGQAKKTAATYLSAMKRMRKWAAAYGPAAGQKVNAEDADIAGMDVEFRDAFNDRPKACSAEALALYLTFKCFEEDLGQSTAEVAYSAAKKYWTNL